MSKKMIAIMKKEFARFFGDKRLVFTTILMPGLMIYILYTLLGQGIMKQFAASEDVLRYPGLQQRLSYPFYRLQQYQHVFF